METLQGEGGIHPATKEFIEGIAAICKEKDIVLILRRRLRGIDTSLRDVLSRLRRLFRLQR